MCYIAEGSVMDNTRVRLPHLLLLLDEAEGRRGTVKPGLFTCTFVMAFLSKWCCL